MRNWNEAYPWRRSWHEEDRVTIMEPMDIFADYKDPETLDLAREGLIRGIVQKFQPGLEKPSREEVRSDIFRFLTDIGSEKKPLAEPNLRLRKVARATLVRHALPLVTPHETYQNVKMIVEFYCEGDYVAEMSPADRRRWEDAMIECGRIIHYQCIDRMSGSKETDVTMRLLFEVLIREKAWRAIKAISDASAIPLLYNELRGYVVKSLGGKAFFELELPRFLRWGYWYRLHELQRNNALTNDRDMLNNHLFFIQEDMLSAFVLCGIGRDRIARGNIDLTDTDHIIIGLRECLIHVASPFFRALRQHKDAFATAVEKTPLEQLQETCTPEIWTRLWNIATMESGPTAPPYRITRLEMFAFLRLMDQDTFSRHWCKITKNPWWQELRDRITFGSGRSVDQIAHACWLAKIIDPEAEKREENLFSMGNEECVLHMPDRAVHMGLFDWIQSIARAYDIIGNDARMAPKLQHVAEKWNELEDYCKRHFEQRHDTAVITSGFANYTRPNDQLQPAIVVPKTHWNAAMSRFREAIEAMELGEVNSYDNLSYILPMAHAAAHVIIED